MRWYTLLALLAVSASAHAQEHPKNFSAAKKALAKLHESTHTTFYCGCGYKIQDRQTDAIEPDTCDLEARKNEKRSTTLEWEHILPASWFFQGRACATMEVREAQCTTASGNVNNARTCCGKIDPVFNAFESDLYNLRPSAGELNGDRSNRRYGEVEGENRVYGGCDFEVDFDKDIAEPPENVRGDIARVVFYMLETYGLRMSLEEITMYQRWALLDPVDAAERDLAERTAAVQGNSNRFVVGRP